MRKHDVVVSVGAKLKNGSNTVRINGHPLRGCHLTSVNVTYDYGEGPGGRYVPTGQNARLSFLTSGSARIEMSGDFYLRVSKKAWGPITKEPPAA